MAVPADADALAVVGGDEDRGVVEVAALAAPGEEGLDLRVGLLDLAQVLVVVAAARVAGLVDAQQLQHQQLGVVVEQGALRLRDQRVVDLVVVHDGGDRSHVVVPERIDEVRDADEAAGHPVAPQHVEERLALHPEAGNEVAVHAVRLGRRAGEHRAKQVTVRAG